MGVAGTPDRARRQLREVAADPLVDVPIISFPPTADDDLIADNRGAVPVDAVRRTTPES